MLTSGTDLGKYNTLWERDDYLNYHIYVEIMEKLPSKTIDLLDKLEELFPDTMITEDLSSFERGKRVGVIELLRLLKQLRDTGE